MTKHIPFLKMLMTIGACTAGFACSVPEPAAQRTLLRGDAPNVALGLRALTEAQTATLRSSIAAAGQPCESVERTYLQGVDYSVGTELWDVRCSDGEYEVEMIPTVEKPNVVRCETLSSLQPCFRAFAPRRQQEARLPLPLP